MFLERVKESPNTMAFQYPVGEGWKSLTWKETEARVRAIALGLRSLGLELENRVGIIANTRYEWVLADLGILAAGGATTTVYPNSTPDECSYILSDSASVIAFAEDDAQVKKLADERSKIPGIKKVVTIDGKSGHDGWVITLAELEEAGRKFDTERSDEFTKVTGSIKKDQLATLIYTSGTTGRPKGVELTHDCWVATGEGMDQVAFLTPADHQYLWLPLSHSFGKVMLTGQLQIGFSTTVDGRIPKLVDNLAIIRPTFMAAAPRIFEKVYNKVVTGAQEAGGAKWKIFSWAVGVGGEVSKARQAGGQPSGVLALKYTVADKLVFSKLREKFGGRVKFFISGSAPLSREMAEFFHAAGILILEGYGLTESSAASFVNRPDKYRFGTVGSPIGSIEVKIAPEDGEILLRGRSIMRGYHNLPEATEEALTPDRWLRTGDIGEFNEGFLKITDRKKDLIKTSGGKYVAPQKLEGQLKALCPYLGQVLVHGNGRNFCSALVTLDPESIKKWADERGIGNLSYEELSKSSKAIEMVQKAVDELNAKLAKYETIKKLAILPKDFTVDGGELTASLKVKRKVIETRYKEILDEFYAGAMADV
ncbi:MAG: long-chain fatty acid--CoA ligase [Deltaproteobacteria bacterium]|nr:long-chain fatty acid--CoA ligase [Deltaproteobacteria bacterium]